MKFYKSVINQYLYSYLNYQNCFYIWFWHLLCPLGINSKCLEKNSFTNPTSTTTFIYPSSLTSFPHSFSQQNYTLPADLDLFLRITLIQKHDIKCINNLDRVKATILKIKELENGHSENSLILTLWNATSVKNKTIELHKFLIDHNTDIAIITETWSSSTDVFKLPNFKLPNYNICRKDGSPANQEEGYS